MPDPVAVTVRQPWASLMAHGILQWDVRPSPPPGNWPNAEGYRPFDAAPIEPGQEVLIHASSKRPLVPRPMHGWQVEPNEVEDWWLVWRGEGPPPIDANHLPLPLGAIIGSARAVDVLPVLLGSKMRRPCIARRDDRLTVLSGRGVEDISDQLMLGSWPVGQWAVRWADPLVFPRPVPHPPSASCPWRPLAAVLVLMAPDPATRPEPTELPEDNDDA